MTTRTTRRSSRTPARKTVRKRASASTRTARSPRKRSTTTTRARSSRRTRTAQATRAAQKIRDVMSVEPVSIVETETVFSTARKMREQNIGDVIVLDETRGHVRGIATDRDIVVRAIAEARDPHETTIGSICSEVLTIVAPTDSIDTAVKLMRERALRRLPVVEDGQAVGIVSIGDLAEHLDRRSALAEISAAPPNV